MRNAERGMIRLRNAELGAESSDYRRWEVGKAENRRWEVEKVRRWERLLLAFSCFLFLKRGSCDSYADFAIAN